MMDLLLVNALPNPHGGYHCNKYKQLVSAAAISGTAVVVDSATPAATIYHQDHYQQSYQFQCNETVS